MTKTAELGRALESAQAYAEYFSRQEIPVLRRTAQELQYFRDELADTITAREVASVVMGDPLMAMRVLMYLQHNRRQSQNHDVTTISRAILMLGIQPFLTTFLTAPVLEESVVTQQDLLGVMRVIARARRAAQFARDWAIVRRDLDVDEITVAALLREATEIVCWVFAPALTRQVYELQAANPQLRTRIAQTRVFGVTAREIQSALIDAWKMPELLIALLDENRDPKNPRVLTVRLAGRLARHLSVSGWDNPAIGDDVRAIEEVLRINREPLLRRIGMPVEYQARFLDSAVG